MDELLYQYHVSKPMFQLGMMIDIALKYLPRTLTLFYMMHISILLITLVPNSEIIKALSPKK